MFRALLIESSSKNCSVAVCTEYALLAVRELANDQYVHSEKLHVFIKEVMEEAQIGYDELSVIAVGKGPGSYTGLRIGVSAAKGLSYVNSTPIVALDSLTILASNLFGTNLGLIVPLMDARRMEVYQAVFNPVGEMVRPIEAKILDEQSYVDLLDQGMVHFVGDGCEKAKEVIKHENAIFHTELKYPSVKQMKALSVKKFDDKAFEDVAYFEPYYLKDFVAGKPKKLL
jgi:tRNA threonylcarbamoyladenosine biosynthesis protein TsaB